MRCLSRWTCVLMVVVSATVFAQQITGNIRGTVVDASGAVVQAAAVTASKSRLADSDYDDGWQRHVRAGRVAGGANVPGFPVGEEDRAQNFVARETHVFSPAVVSVLRFWYLRNKFLFDEHINHQLPCS